ncbi:Beta-apo-4'-carotenal oxygenase [Ceratocystis fimbriata CBS 114723]|uniref:Aldehyde dehydrogenase n=1 Tax=Ceratocystis fimbriata CBS 114723 TaxID=1035309 RepID=A0A2C5WVS0_9PEZI|nr:Beta-apo-4'-carotenal oxygenase [Ceratocystis fimbriata CBS 114723]
MAPKLPPSPPVPTGLLTYTPTAIDEIPSTVASVRQAYGTLKTHNVDFRITQLRKLYWAIEDYSDLLTKALCQDLRMSSYEADLLEINIVRGLILDTLSQIHSHVADEKVPNLPLTTLPTRVRIRKEPLGVVLIISPYNFPVQLSLSPAISAIAAGCAFVLKPSESSSATSAVLTHIITSRLDPDVYRVVNGEVAETTALLDQKWDKIFYTGGNAVAKIICKKAAETLTPVGLELGGLNPAFITPSANVAMAARRLMWPKLMNCGQVCVSQNYALVDRKLVPEFIAALKKEYDLMFPQGAKQSSDLSRIINARQFARIKGYLDQTRGKVVIGGDTDETELFIGPTVVLVEDEDDILIQNETFGPVWSILPVDSTDEAIAIANRVCPTTLAIYPFGDSKETEKILSRVTSGGATVNDGFLHATIEPLPFGGVGQSGTGALHGRAGFDEFTHRRTVMINPTWTDAMFRVRYMPYKLAYLKQFRSISPKPDFGHDNQDLRGIMYWIKLVLGLGRGSSASGFLLRLALTAATVYVVVNSKDTDQEGWMGLVRRYTPGFLRA